MSPSNTDFGPGGQGLPGPGVTCANGHANQRDATAVGDLVDLYLADGNQISNSEMADLISEMDYATGTINTATGVRQRRFILPGTARGAERYVSDGVSIG
jgi:hypothetical protein